MQEEQLFLRTHEALDIDLPVDGFEQLRAALTRKSVRPQSKPAMPARWSRTGFKIAAGVALVAIAAAAAAAILAKHPSLNTAPAHPQTSISAYQKMIEADYRSATVVWNSQCDIGFHTGCGTDAARAIPVLQKWLDDLNRAATPARFTFVDAELRAQLTQSLSADRDLVAAAQADDGTAMDTAYIVSYYAVNWTAVIVPAILGSHQVSAALYASSVSQHRADLDSCVVYCLLLATQQDCTLGNILHPCYSLIGDVAVRFTNFEASLAQAAAPDSLATKDNQLQADLAEANRILLSWRRAVGASDQAGVDAGVGPLKAIILKIDRDADSIAQAAGS